MKESQLFVGLSRERGHTMGVTVEREGGHGGPVVDEVRSSGGKQCCGVRRASHFRQFSGGLLSSVI